MGLFKKLGSSLKRAISIKNITRAATGNFSAIGKDVLRIASTEDPKEVRKKQAEALAKGQTYTPAPVVPIEMPNEVQVILDSKGAIVKKQVQEKLANSETVQNASSLAINTMVLAYWQKYKAWFIGLVFSLIAFFTIRMLLKGSKRGKSRR